MNIDVSSHPSASQIARGIAQKREAAWDAIVAALGEKNAYPRKEVEKIVEKHGCKLVAYRHQGDVWVEELPAGQDAVEIFAPGGNQPIYHGPAFAVFEG